MRTGKGIPLKMDFYTITKRGVNLQLRLVCMSVPDESANIWCRL